MLKYTGPSVFPRWHYATVLARQTLEGAIPSKNPFVRLLGGLDPDKSLSRVRARRVSETNDWLSAKTTTTDGLRLKSPSAMKQKGEDVNQIIE